MLTVQVLTATKKSIEMNKVQHICTQVHLRHKNNQEYNKLEQKILHDVEIINEVTKGRE